MTTTKYTIKDAGGNIVRHAYSAEDALDEAQYAANSWGLTAYVYAPGAGEDDWTAVQPNENCRL